MPVFNERDTIEAIIDRVLAVDVDKELVIVDDASTDGTREWLRDYAAGAPGHVRVFFHDVNGGKGAAVAKGVEESRGAIVVFQDADLEYEPEEYARLIVPIVDGASDVVYGSRFLGEHRDFSGAHFYGNKLLTGLTNLIYGSRLTDMETCYKCFRREVIAGMTIRARRFDLEPEVTAKALRAGHAIVEVPISYTARGFHEGKKITWRDGFSAVWTLVRCRFNKR